MPRPRRHPRPAAAPAAPGDAHKAAMLAKVHIARKDLGLDEDSYRDVLVRVTGQDSAKALDAAGLDKLLGEFKRLGWKPAKAATPRSDKAQVGMIYGLWKAMRPLLQDPSPQALRAFCQRQTRTPAHPDGISAPEFLSAPMANRVIEGLKAWHGRLIREKAGVPGGEAA